jgi:MFS family permease
VNGVGALGQMISPFLVLSIAHRFGWNSIFNLLALTSFIAASVLTFRWESTEIQADAVTFSV